jgi:Lrp/AsnC family transcriptional regulator for asnA, asnC and gidA
MIDNTDYQLILMLQANAREKNVDIAENLGISEAGVRKRLARLIEDNIIELTALPNLAKLGYHSTAFIGLHVRQGLIEEVANRLGEHPDIHFVGIVAGQYDILIWVARHSAGDLARFLKEDLPKINGIERAETLVLLEMKKRTQGRLSETALTSNSGNQINKSSRSRTKKNVIRAAKIRNRGSLMEKTNPRV